MAMTGPKYYRDAMRLYDKAKSEKNPTEKALLLAEANLNMQAAVLAALVHGGTADQSAIKEWMSYGVYLGDRHGR